MKVRIYCNGFLIDEATTNEYTVKELEAAGFRVVRVDKEVE